MKTKQMKQRLQEKWLKTLGKFPRLPGVGQLDGGFSPVLKDHNGVVGEEEEFKSFGVVVNNKYMISYPTLVSKCFLVPLSFLSWGRSKFLPHT